MFSSGRILFVVAFIIAFVLGIAYAYRKDLRVSRLHYKGSFWVFVVIVLIFSILFLLVKFRH
jgi:hypothetical protein